MSITKTIVAATIPILWATMGWSATGKATISGTVEGSEVFGTATFEEANGGLNIVAHLEEVPPGEHGFHIHEFGDCSDTGKNAGSHFNPMGTQHGHVTKDGMGKAHPGDLGNVVIKKDGTGELKAFVPGLSLSSGTYNVAGRAVVLHEKADDFDQPVGNAGGRIGCGTIMITGK